MLLQMGYSPMPPYTPSPPPEKSNNMPLLYYGLVVVGTAGVVLLIYNLIILRWCSYTQPDRTRDGISLPMRRQLQAAAAAASSRSSDNPNAHLISSFRYKKEGGSSSYSGEVIGGGTYNEYECVVCLSVFEEDEELKQLPRCKHSFHAPCIDMWLYSHLDCPLCRSPVDPPPFLNRVVTTPTRLPNSRISGEGLLASVAV